MTVWNLTTVTLFFFSTISQQPNRTPIERERERERERESLQAELAQGLLDGGSGREVVLDVGLIQVQFGA
jgi:hypothetical protein